MNVALLTDDVRGTYVMAITLVLGHASISIGRFLSPRTRIDDWPFWIEHPYDAARYRIDRPDQAKSTGTQNAIHSKSAV